MDLLVFDISGKFAHFRKYYTNSSSLTYLVPPRTSIYGLIAGILGLERDSYYEKFNPEEAFIGVKLLSENRRIMQSLNYLKLEGKSDFVAPKNHTQIPFEVLTNDKCVKYRIYFSHKDEEIMEELRRRLRDKKYYYSPYLGAAPFGCKIELIEYRKNEYKEVHEKISIDSIVNVKYIQDETIDLISKPLMLAREIMPRYFDKDRFLQETASYILETRGETLEMCVNEKVMSIEYEDKIENIVFM